MWLIMQLSNDHHHHIKLKQQEQVENKSQNLCLDKAYHSKEVEQEILKEDTFHIYDTEERKKKLFHKKHPARRWVVERTNSWHNRFRKLLTRYEKKDENYLGLVQLSCV